MHFLHSQWKTDKTLERKDGAIPEFLLHALGRFGIDLSKVHLIDEPAVLERVIIPIPLFQIGGAQIYSTPLQANVWDAFQNQQGPRSKALAVYLSRRRYQLGSRSRRPLANEVDVENLFQRCGFSVVCPRT